MTSEAWGHFDEQSGRIHRLEDHLRDTGQRAGCFAREFGSGEWGRLAGRWHDLGKYGPDFQKMIRAAAGEQAHVEQRSRVDHSSSGAAFAIDRLGSQGRPLALVIAGHHAGIPDWSRWTNEREPRARERLEQLRLKLAEVPEDLLAAGPLEPPAFLMGGRGEERSRRREFWTRLLFSALVDADFLDTEAFFSGDREFVRGDRGPAIDELASRLHAWLDRLGAGPEKGAVDAVRREVLAHCRAAATKPPGVFTLTVPTGGGKTYASLSFALEHARRHDLERVIVVAPFLTIIDQTTRAFRKALQQGDEEVLIEHHSAIDPETESARNRLVAENWDATLVVTTAVQFYESLFANRPSACRKLHNLVRSAVVLDEIQTVPKHRLLPILDVLQQLVDHYGTTLVLSTATQPELQERPDPAGRGRLPGFRTITEINGDASSVRAHFDALRRVAVEHAGPCDWKTLATRIAEQPQALAIVHRRSDACELAAEVARHVPADSVYHLSALLCAAHRQERLAAIRAALEEQREVRVVSTQLVEAGVDLDFPVVFRAMAGLDSLIQSAGRCNREGRLAQGRLVVFDAPTAPPPGYLRTAADTARAMLAGDPELDLFAPDTYREFDRRLASHLRDEDGIQGLRARLEFQEVASRFRLIEDKGQTAVAVPWGAGEQILAEAVRTHDPRALRRIARRLQPYTVNIRRQTAQDWVARGILELIADLILALAAPYRAQYDERFGLLAQAGAAAPEEYIA